MLLGSIGNFRFTVAWALPDLIVFMITILYNGHVYELER